MSSEIDNLVNEIKQSMALLRRHLDWDNALLRLEELDSKAEGKDFWLDQIAAQKIMKERTTLELSIKNYQTLEQDLSDAIMLVELGESEGDAEVVIEGSDSISRLHQKAVKLELESLLSGEVDPNDCYVEINAGAGGTEAQDWAEMISRMYMRWAEAHGYTLELFEESAGEEAGIKSITYRVNGVNAYGWLKTESGVHRLVRISPFDSSARRHTSFASVWVYPVIDDEIEIEIDEKECRIDTYRSSGAGGQHVNKTDSAVRITHNPTGIAVQCQSQRSQHQNKAKCWEMLRARLYELELQMREQKAQDSENAKSDIGWGHQIRSYVLQPYQMVKDLRTNHETSDTQGVLDGDLDQFMSASLAARIRPERSLDNTD
ncbi:MAG: peptide chain release factor 2 [Rhodospirillaceae bacterium]|nr:peptide chain release factor 2 [Rhodospirillaceae bacterium]